MRIDSHHHFWKYDPAQYAWIDEGMGILRRDFLSADLQREISGVGIDGVLSVQARQSVDETRWLLELAAQQKFVLGVVGWVPLSSPEVETVLAGFAESDWLKGVRHVVQGEPDDEFILGAAFNRGIAHLKKFGLVYDILIFARHLPNTIKFVDQHPDQPFVLDHIAKPTIQAARFDEAWRTHIKELAKRKNVSCKFSGVATEVRDAEWTLETVRPYWNTVLDAFGPERLMFGSDWPVCLLKTGYRRWVESVQELARGLKPAEQAAIFGGNAASVYGLTPPTV